MRPGDLSPQATRRPSWRFVPSSLLLWRALARSVFRGPAVIAAPFGARRVPSRTVGRFTYRFALAPAGPPEN